MTIIAQIIHFSNINSKLYVKIFLGDMMKKMNIFYAILITLGLSIMTSFMLAITYKVSRIWSVAYVSCYLIMLVVLGKWFKNDLVENAKNFKNDVKNNWKKILFFTFAFTILLYVSNYIVVKLMGSASANEVMSQNQLKASPLLMSISICLLSPMVEEIIYRLPYKKIEKHKLLNFFIYTFVFAIAHIAFNNGIMELIYLIPYLFLSLSIGYGFYKTDNIFVSMIIHILNNFINVMIILFL